MMGVAKALLLAIGSYIVVYVAMILVNSMFATTYHSEPSLAVSRTLTEMNFLARFLTHLVPGLVLGYCLRSRVLLWGIVLGFILAVPPVWMSGADPTFGYLGDPISLHLAYIAITALSATSVSAWKRP